MFAAFTLALVWACVGVVPAFGAGTRLYQSSFGFFSSPAALTVDQQTGDVYGVDNASGLVRRYDSTGAAKDFTAGPDTGTNTLGGSSPFVFFGFAGGVAVDDSGGPSDGDIYVLDLGGPSSTGELHVYSNTGALLGTVDGTDTPNGSFAFACGVTVDQANGDVYVGDANDFTNGLVLRYSPSGGTVVESDYSGGIKAAGPICGVAVAQGHLYTADTFAFGDVRSYATSDFATGAPPSPSSTLIDSGVNAIAADPANGDVYVDKGESISVFGSSGSSLYSFGSGDFGGSLGVAVGGPAGGAYVADGNAAEIDAYGPFVAGSAPASATTTTAGQITHITATLGGHLDPGDDPSVTACHFDYLSASDFSANGDSYSGPHTPVTVPCTEGNSYTAPADVSADLTGLHPGTTYHYHLRITGSVTGEVTGGDQTLTTTDFPVTTDPATHLHHTDVVLNGHFDPQSDPPLAVTACSFDWVSDAQFQIDQFASAQSTDCAEGQSFASAQSVSAVINNLTPGSTYHFRLHLSTVGAGENTGQDRTVTPPIFPTISPQIAAFGPDGTGGSSFTTSNAAASPSSLGFDQASRRLYALDKAAPGVYGFDASSPPAYPQLLGFAPLSTAPTGGAPGLAVDDTALSSAGNLYFVSENTQTIYGFDSTGAVLGGNFPISPVGGTDICGDAVDSAGHLWVADFHNKKLLEYDSAGNPLSSLDVSPQIPTGGPCSLAFDTNDNLYVARFQGATFRYTAASGHTAATQIDSGPNESLAVDPATDDLYVAHEADVKRYDAAGNLEGTLATGISGANFDGVAVDSTNHDLYVADAAPTTGQGQIRVFHPSSQRPPTITAGDPTALTGSSATLNAKVDPETSQVTDCHFDWGTDASYGNTAPCVPDPGSGSGDVSVHADISGLNGGSAYHFRIVAQNAEPGGSATGADQTLTTLGPRISATSADHVSDTAATLHAQVDSRGHSTTYQFQYGSDASYGRFAPAVPAAIGSGSSAIAVAEHIDGLGPGATYHFRLIAQSSDGTDTGPDAVFTTFASPAGGVDSCPNASLRTGPAAALPDCRAYEQASPTDKNGSPIAGAPTFNEAAADGHAAVFTAFGNLPSSGGNPLPVTYVASRGPTAWSYDSALPPFTTFHDGRELGRDDNLRVSLGAVGPASDKDLFATDLGDFSHSQLVPAAEPLQNPQFADDTAHFIFESSAALTPDAADNGGNGQNLYDYDHGALTLAGRVPAFPATTCTDGGPPADDCTGPAAGSFAGSYDTPQPGVNNVAGELASGHGYKQHTISADGSRVFFTEGGTGRLYERRDGTSTVQLNADQGGNDPNGDKPAAFQAATSSGSKVFFASCEKLTPDSTAVATAAGTCLTSGQGQDLYVYDTSSGNLSDLTVDTNGSDAHGAQVQGMLGASADGAYVYFAANGVLAPGASPGNCDPLQNVGDRGACNIYLAHAGHVVLVARVNGDADAGNWQSQRGGFPFYERSSRVGGGALLFSSDRSLTGYDNAGNPELYRFDSDAGRLECVSCNPTGAPAFGPPHLQSTEQTGRAGFQNPEFTLLTRNLSASGDRVFFETPDKLVVADTNGDGGCPEITNQVGLGDETFQCEDVYEWEAEGAGSCRSHAQNGGCLYLLSSGTGDGPSYLDDASASGDDVFIFTADRLVPQDTDSLTDLYDVRTEGGLASQHQVPLPPCTGDACQGTPSAQPAVAGVASVTFSGPGNANATRRAATGKVKILTRTVRGSRFLLKVGVPGKGRITITGAGIRTVRRSVPNAGTYKLGVTLTAKEKKLLRHKRRLKLRVSYAPVSGMSSSVTFSITDKA